MRRNADIGARGFETVQLADGMSYELPRRPLGWLRVFGVLPIVVGGIFIAGPLSMVHPLVTDSLFEEGPDRYFAVVFIAFALLFALTGFAPIGLGLAVLVGRNAVQITGEHLRTVERVGPLRWSRKREKQQVRRLEVVSTISVMAEQHYPDDASNTRNLEVGIKSIAGLRAHLDDQSSILIAWGYPRGLLRELADRVADECKADQPARLFDDEDNTAIAVTEREIDLAAGDNEEDKVDGSGGARPTKPTGSSIVAEVQPDGVTLRIPPAGLRKGSKGQFGFAIVWIVFMAVFTTLMFVGEWPRGMGMIAPLGILLLFWLIGIAMLVGAINAGRRRAIIDVIGDTLLVSRQSLLGRKQYEWRAGQLSHIRFGPSGTEVNDKPVMQLQIFPKDGKKIGLLSQVSDDELRWIASELRHALGVPRRPSEDDDAAS